MADVIYFQVTQRCSDSQRCDLLLRVAVGCQLHHMSLTSKKKNLFYEASNSFGSSVAGKQIDEYETINKALGVGVEQTL